MDGASIGPAVGVAFGCVWGIAGATALPSYWQGPTIVSCVGISAVLLAVLALPRKRRELGIFRGRMYGMAVLFESAAILARSGC
jgi:hypothetical protein